MKGRRFLVVGLSLLGGLAGACGPSFQAIYEGNARFEHCYALEENSQVAMPEKADCWRDWSERYTYGQTRDRIHYATARYVALSQVPNIPTDEAMMMAAPGVTPRQTVINAPAPTNAFAPPPKVLDEGDSGPPMRPLERHTVLGVIDGGPAPASGPRQTPEPAVNARTAPPPLPASSCGSACASTFEKCGDAGVGCEKTYRACMRGCFK